MTSSDEYYTSKRNSNTQDARFSSSTRNTDNNYNRNYNQNNFSTKHQHHNNSRWSRTQHNSYGNNRNTNDSFRNNSRRNRGRRNNNQYTKHYHSYNNNNHNPSYQHPLDRLNLNQSSLHSANRQRNSNRFNRQTYKPRITTTAAVTSSDIGTKCAYATMVINNAEYLAGAFTLAWSLIIAGCKADIIVIIDQEIDSKYGELISLSGLFTDKLVIPKKLKFTAIQKRWKRYAESGIYDWINTAFNKYYVFTLTQYRRVIMLDADQICLQNMDHLFLLKCPAGICSLYSDTRDALQKKHHGNKVSNGDIRRSYERNWGIKGCLFMIEPSQDVFKDMVQELEYLQMHNNGVGDRRFFIGADEKYLTEYFMSKTNDSGDSNWTHIHAKYSRLSYIDKTTLRDDPYLLHFCTFKPWKSPGNNKWIHEQWEDIAIWMYASKAAAQYITEQLPLEGYTQVVTEIMSADPEFYASVLQQKWSTKYMEFKTSNANSVLLDLYHLMADSYKEQQAIKQNQTVALKEKITQNVGNERYKKHNISFDYSKYLLLSALLLEQNEEKTMIPDKVIWQFWDTPEDEMPVNIKFCVDSVRRNNADWKHVLLTPQNIAKYLSENELKLPANLLQFEKACHISDVVRVAILAKYGGIYCDASVICFKDCEFMDFDYIWDELLMRQSYDFVGFRYDEKRKWKYDERFCCWFMATKKDNGLFYSWLNKINLLMKDGKTCSSQLDVIDLLSVDETKSNAFKKYVALGPGILDELFEEYCHYHRNFKYMLYDPRDFALLDELFNYEPLWYLDENQEYDFKKWFEKQHPHFIKLFCAEKGSKQLYEIIKHKFNYKQDKQVSLQDILSSGLIIADVFGLV